MWPRFERDDQRQSGLDEDGQLQWLEEDAAVRRDESIPQALVVTEREQELPVVELGHAWIDRTHRDEVRVGLEVLQDVDDRLREVLVEREEPRHLGSGGDGP